MASLTERERELQAFLDRRLERLLAIRAQRDGELKPLNGQAEVLRHRLIRMAAARETVLDRVAAINRQISDLHDRALAFENAVTRIDNHDQLLRERLLELQYVAPKTIRQNYRQQIRALQDGKVRRYRRDLEKIRRRLTAKRERLQKKPMAADDMAVGKLPETMTDRLKNNANKNL